MSSTVSDRPIIHLLPNAHIDPVWLWDWREGLNEGLGTVKAVLDLMDEFPQLTFLRGEAAIYEHIEKTDAKLFDRIVGKVAEGRWDVVGGTYIQPDTNLTSTEVLCRQFEYGMAYFQKRFGKKPRIAWLADSFGHSEGLPNIFTAFGIEGFAFTRPPKQVFPLACPAFRWQGTSKAEVLCYRPHWRSYATNRDNIAEALNDTLSGKESITLRNRGTLIGLGNHGGGPTRAHIRQVIEWQEAHPEVEVRFSTLHGFFEALKTEIEESGTKVPVVKEELGFCLRGCYSSVQKFKTSYREAESLVTQAEATRAAVAATLATYGKNGHHSTSNTLAESWRTLLFNCFHDILPGSSIERAMDEQLDWVGQAKQGARSIHFTALNKLAGQVDCRVPAPHKEDAPCDVPMLVWNSQAHPFDGYVELEVSPDHRPLWLYEHRPEDVPVVVHDGEGRPLVFQKIATEHSCFPQLPARIRVLVRLKIAAFGWTVVRIGLRDKKPAAKTLAQACAAKAGRKEKTITGSGWSITARDSGQLKIQRGGISFPSEKPIRIELFEDIWGAWGGMNEEPDSFILKNKTEGWRITRSEVLEKGPLRSRLWTRWEGKRSWIELTFSVSRGMPWVDVQARLLLNERSKRLKLVLPCEGAVTSDVAGGTTRRKAQGHLPVGRWIKRSGGMGFASAALSDMDFTDKEVRITLARATRLGNDVPTAEEESPWLPATDLGELKFSFRLFGPGIDPDRVAEGLMAAPITQLVPATSGDLPPSGSLGELSPENFQLLSLQSLPEGGWKVRIQNRGTATKEAAFRLGPHSWKLSRLRPQEIATWELHPQEPSMPSRETRQQRLATINTGNNGKAAGLPAIRR